MSLTKIMSFVAILISAIFYWTTSNVCKYNFAIDKKTKLLNILTFNNLVFLSIAKLYLHTFEVVQ